MYIVSRSSILSNINQDILEYTNNKLRDYNL